MKCGHQNLTLANYCEKCGSWILRIGYSEQRFYGSLDVVNDDSALGVSKWDVLDSQIPLTLRNACEGVFSGIMAPEEFRRVAEFQAELAAQKLQELQSRVIEPDDARQLELNASLVRCFTECAKAASLMLEFVQKDEPSVLDEAKELIEQADLSLYTARTTARKFTSLLPDPAPEAWPYGE